MPSKSESLARRKAALTAEQRTELERRLRCSGADIERAERTAPLPLSRAQERIWLHQQMYPGSLAYNRPAPLRLRGPLQGPLLHDALQQLIRRHDVLRTTVTMQDGQPLLRVCETLAFDLPVTDLTCESNAEKRCWEIAAEEARRPFDLQRGPLLHARLVRLAIDDHLLVLIFHHFLFDAWSHNVLLRDLAAFYDALANGRASRMRELPIQYADFAAWERRQERTSKFSDGRSYWKKTLTDLPALQLPIDFSPGGDSEEADRVDIRLPPRIVAGLGDLACLERTTLFSTLLAAFFTLLHRYTQQDEIIVGCPVAGRIREETEPLIGVFINTLPLRGSLADGTTFRQLLRQIRQTTIDSLSHQCVPLQIIAQDVLTDRAQRAASPLFQTLFVYEHMPLEPRTAAGVVFHAEECDTKAAVVDLSLELVESARGIDGCFHYRCALWDRQSIVRLAGHFLTLLEVIVANPDQALAEFQILTTPERQQLLVEWNSTTADYPRDKCVHALFDEQVERTPNALAVHALQDQRTQNYRELQTRANQLANHLRRLGIQEESRVVLLVPRSIEAMIGILGILKAGAVFVPLDSGSAPERLARILHDLQPAAILTVRELASDECVSGYRVVLFDDPEIESANGAAPHTAVTPRNAAYIIYTSGSTGVPNGVVVEHASLVNYCHAAIHAYGLNRNDRVLQVAPLIFDGSLEEILPTWLAGATLMLRSDEMLDSVAGFVEVCREHAITLVALVTSLWRWLANQLREEDLAIPDSIRLITLGGEAVPQGDVLRWRERFGSRVRLLNTYGPTEATVVATMCDLSHENEAAISKRGVPIGRPIANSQAHVLDRNMQLVPVGVPGELFIGGAGLARRYHNRRQLTAERFVANPFSACADDRLYRTGDRVRRRADGALEFLGRLDNQVKLRGYRIELGEIESVLLQHPLVREAAVSARQNTHGELMLTAYVVLDPAAQAGQVRAFLGGQLPDYMVPAALVVLDRLPLSPNGKVDRRALPAPEFESDAASFCAPRTPLEELLGGIWTELLGIPRVSVHDNFFHIGGHSLLATRVVARIHSVLNVAVPLRKLFEAPTIAALATELVVQLAKAA